MSSFLSEVAFPWLITISLSFPPLPDHPRRALGANGRVSREQQDRLCGPRRAPVRQRRLQRSVRADQSARHVRRDRAHRGRQHIRHRGPDSEGLRHLRATKSGPRVHSQRTERVVPVGEEVPLPEQDGRAEGQGEEGQGRHHQQVGGKIHRLYSHLFADVWQGQSNLKLSVRLEAEAQIGAQPAGQPNRQPQQFERVWGRGRGGGRGRIRRESERFGAGFAPDEALESGAV